ncbi:MAG: HAD-IA family hydrolase [Halioglobus sp.]|nr:HAD-IA family hydrolase [Halioglobus sp.]
MNGHFRAVLFDLDGTLVDTAPDMVAALFRLQEELGESAIDYNLARANVSNGAAGLIRVGFPAADDNTRIGLQRRFLRIYQQRVCAESRLFPGFPEMLDSLQIKGRPWGVVTNKPQAFTDAIMVKLGLSRRMHCAISGDTLPQRKPDPAPMLLASRILNVEPKHIVYVGDAARDIQAGRAAGMATIAAAWGYITADDDPYAWHADLVAESPTALAAVLSNGLG